LISNPKQILSLKRKSVCGPVYTSANPNGIIKQLKSSGDNIPGSIQKSVQVSIVPQVTSQENVSPGAINDSPGIESSFILVIQILNSTNVSATISSGTTEMWGVPLWGS